MKLIRSIDESIRIDLNEVGITTWGSDAEDCKVAISEALEINVTILETNRDKLNKLSENRLARLKSMIDDHNNGRFDDIINKL